MVLEWVISIITVDSLNGLMAHFCIIFYPYNHGNGDRRQISKASTPNSQDTDPLRISLTSFLLSWEDHFLSRCSKHHMFLLISSQKSGIRKECNVTHLNLTRVTFRLKFSMNSKMKGLGHVGKNFCHHWASQDVIFSTQGSNLQKSPHRGSSVFCALLSLALFLSVDISFSGHEISLTLGKQAKCNISWKNKVYNEIFIVVQFQFYYKI